MTPIWEKRNPELVRECPTRWPKLPQQVGGSSYPLVLRQAANEAMPQTDKLISSQSSLRFLKFSLCMFSGLGGEKVDPFVKVLTYKDV